jgi:hypothetical protein
MKTDHSTSRSVYSTLAIISVSHISSSYWILSAYFYYIEWLLSVKQTTQCGTIVLVYLNNQLWKKSKEAAVAYFTALSRYLPGRIYESWKYSVPWTRFEPRDFTIGYTKPLFYVVVVFLRNYIPLWEKEINKIIFPYEKKK